MFQRMVAACVLFVALVASAHAQNQFTATLSGDQERPNPVVTDGTGSGTATFDPATNMLSVHLEFSNLSSNTIDAHIHCCTSVDAGVGVALGFSATFPLGVTSGTFDQSYDLLSAGVYTANFLNNFGGGTAAGARDALLNAMRATDPNMRAYFNIHTVEFGPGEIRGNIAPIPEPAALLLALCALAATACPRRAR
jgi:hypothetical protein